MKLKNTIIEDLKEMLARLRTECTSKTDNILALGDRVKWLEAENEKLKHYKASKLATYENMQREWNEAVKENRKLKQALYEIEQLVDEGRFKLGGAGHYLAYLVFIKEVIQKLSEVNNDR